MINLKIYQNPTLEVVEFDLERGVCVSLEFTPEVQGYGGPNGYFGMDDMSESTDNAAW